MNITKTKTGRGRKKLSVKLIKGKKDTSTEVCIQLAIISECVKRIMNS